MPKKSMSVILNNLTQDFVEMKIIEQEDKICPDT